MGERDSTSAYIGTTEYTGWDAEDGQLLLSPLLLKILGRVRTKVNFWFMMDTRRGFVANLAKEQSHRANLLPRGSSTPSRLAVIDWRPSARISTLSSAITSTFPRIVRSGSPQKHARIT